LPPDSAKQTKVYPGIFIREAQEAAYFSIGQIIDESDDDSDFRKSFSDYEGAVALYLDEMYKGWKLGIT
jgi:hypothetical protein